MEIYPLSASNDTKFLSLRVADALFNDTCTIIVKLIAIKKKIKKKNKTTPYFPKFSKH